MSDDRWLGMKEITEHLGVSRETVVKWIENKKMPEELKEAHHQLDLAVERCYRSTPFKSDEERLEHLFNLYERMIATEGR